MEVIIAISVKIREYFNVIGLDLIINEADGYAYVRQKEIPEEFGEGIPVLMSRRQLSYPVTLLSVLIRKRLLEFELSGNESRLVLSIEDIKEMTRIFQDTITTNEKKQTDAIARNVNKLIDYGFLIPLKNEEGKYEVSKILSAYITIDKLNEIYEKLKTYRESVNSDIKED